MLTEEDDSGSSSGGDASCCGRCDRIWLAQAGTVGQPFVEDGRLKVMASFYPMYDFARKVGGDRIQIKDMFLRERSS